MKKDIMPIISKLNNIKTITTQKSMYNTCYAKYRKGIKSIVPIKLTTQSLDNAVMDY